MFGIFKNCERITWEFYPHNILYKEGMINILLEQIKDIKKWMKNDEIKIIEFCNCKYGADGWGSKLVSGGKDRFNKDWDQQFENENCTVEFNCVYGYGVRITINPQCCDADK